MSSLREFMSDDHRHCDDLFADIEKAVADKRWSDAEASMARFQKAMAAHFASEEEVLFPAFEEATGMSVGPTQVMRMEHEQMRELLSELAAALAQHDRDDSLGQAETLLIMMQQHNMKEEGILYPMCDQHLTSSLAPLLSMLRERLPGHG